MKRVILLKGEGTDELIGYLKGADGKLIDGVYDDFEVAVNRSGTLAISGDAVLLSPGCASFSMFKNEFDRGEQFNQIIRKWQKK